jgi:cytochrome bd-type quinol oxidase subunit 1
VLTTLISFVLVYLALLGTYVWYVARVVRQGPGGDPRPEPAVPSVQPQPLPGPAPAV